MLSSALIGFFGVMAPTAAGPGAEEARGGWQLTADVQTMCSAAVTGGRAFDNAIEFAVDQSCNASHDVTITYDLALAAEADIVVSFGNETRVASGEGVVFEQRPIHEAQRRLRVEFTGLSTDAARAFQRSVRLRVAPL